MNNKYVLMYCEHFNLAINPSLKVPGENFIIDNGKSVGFYRDNSKYIEFHLNEYKKSDLLNFILEEKLAHERSYV